MAGGVYLPGIFNAKELDYSFKETPIEDFNLHASPFLSDIVKAKHLDFNVKSLDPGKFSCPYHFHRNSEELFVILSGKSTLRIPDKFTELKPGDIVFFETGPAGAHQLYNHTSEPCVYLDLASENGLDVCEYPDSGKINILPERDIFQSVNRVGYYTGEDKVREKWPDEILNITK